MGGVAVPGPDQVEPGAVGSDLAAKLLLDRRIDQDAVDVWQAGGDVEQGDDPRGPDAGVDVATVGTHQAAQCKGVALSSRKRGAGLHVQTDIGVEADLVADMATGQRAAPGAGDVLDEQGRQTCLIGFAAEQFEVGNGLRRAPEGAAVEMDGLKADALGRQADGSGDAATDIRAADNMERTGGGRVGDRGWRCYRHDGSICARQEGEYET